MRVTYFLTHPIQYQSPLIRHLRDAGMELEVVYGAVETAGSYYDPGFSREISWGVPLLDGYPHRLLPKTRGFRQLVRACREAITATGAEAVWVHGWGFPLCRASWLAAKQCRVPVLLRGEAHLGCVLSRGLQLLAHRALLSVCFRSVRHFLAIGTANHDFYRAHRVAEERISLMPYAVDNSFFQQRCQEASAGREKLRQELGLPAGAPVILYCGKLAPEKDPETLFRAAAALQSGWAGAASSPVLLIVGDGAMRGQLETLASGCRSGSVKFVGFRNQTELPAYYDLCDVLVLPSVFEPWGLVVNEVMNAGKPVVVSDQVGCARDLVKTGVNGDWFRAGDVDDLVRALRPFLEDESKRRAAGAQSLAIVNRWNYDEDHRVLQDVLSHLKDAAREP